MNIHTHTHAKCEIQQTMCKRFLLNQTIFPEFTVAKSKLLLIVASVIVTGKMLILLPIQQHQSIEE